jgi:hypothetical protein
MELAMKKHKHVKPRLKITATVYDVTKEESYYRTRFRTVDGKRREILIGREMFSRRGRVVDHLLKAHAAIADDNKAATKLVEKALSNRSDRQFHVTSRAGWYGDSFVYLTETFGALAGKLRHDGQIDIDPALGQRRGALKAWREGLRLPCKYSDFLIFTIGVAASGPLLELIGEDEGGVFHLQPENRAKSTNDQLKLRSSSGKTLAARAGMSTIGRCRKSDLVTFAATERGVEDYCFAHNHLVAVFDEEGRALNAGQGIKQSNLPYLVTSGVGKLRSKKATQDPDLQNLKWALPAISTGENPLDDPSKQAVRPEGAQARMIPIPVPPGGEGGIFNRVEGTRSGVTEKCRKLARLVEETIDLNYGVVMPAYLQQLVAERPKLIERIRRIIDRFIEKVRADHDPWEQRFAAKFGIALAGAILLSEFDLGPWTKKRAYRAISTIYRKARASSVSADEAADRLVRVLRKCIKARRRFPQIKKGRRLAPREASSVWGAVCVLPNGQRVVATPFDRVEKLVKPAAIARAVLQVLAHRKVVLRSSDGKLTRQIMMKGLTGIKRPRFVCFVHKKIMRQPEPGVS